MVSHADCRLDSGGGITSGVLAVHFSRSVPHAAAEPVRHVPAAGMQAAGAIRVPVKPVEAPANGAKPHRPGAIELTREA